MGITDFVAANRSRQESDRQDRRNRTNVASTALRCFEMLGTIGFMTSASAVLRLEGGKLLAMSFAYEDAAQDATEETEHIVLDRPDGEGAESIDQKSLAAALQDLEVCQRVAMHLDLLAEVAEKAIEQAVLKAVGKSSMSSDCEKVSVWCDGKLVYVLPGRDRPRVKVTPAAAVD